MDSPLSPADAAALAQGLLHDLPRRWEHVKAVGTAAEATAGLLGLSDTDQSVLVSAAWLHDIGYGLTSQPHHWHPLDGAEYLRCPRV